MNKLVKWFLHSVSLRTYSANTIEELETKWNEIMYKGWDVDTPLDVRWNWFKFDYEYYFIAKYVG